MASSNKRVCVIGAGPSGLAVLYHFANIGCKANVEVVCFEKQSTWEGMWTYDGEHEFEDTEPDGACKPGTKSPIGNHARRPDFMFEESLGKFSSVMPARLALKDYLEGRWKSKVNLEQFIKPHVLVRYVQYNDSTDAFSVTSTNLVTNETSVDTFSHVIVATGIFNVPIIPSFPGIETFQGRILYAHNLNSSAAVKGLRILIVGAPYSIEDLAVKCMKLGAKSVICTCKTKQSSFRLANGIDHRPYLQKLDGNLAYFKDRTIAEIDCLMLGTGYLYSYRFMEDGLRLKSSPSFYADNLYKGCIWMGGANNKLFYLGTQDRLYSLTLFDAQGVWVCKYILKQLPSEPKSTIEMRRNVKEWVQRSSRATSFNDYVNFLKEFISDLGKDFGRPLYTTATEITKFSWSRFRPHNSGGVKERRRVSSYPSNSQTSPSVPYHRFYSLPD